MGAPISEQETVVQFDRDGETMNIYTSDTTIMTKLDKIYKRKREHRADGQLYAVEYDVDKRLLTFRSKRTKLNLTDEQRKAAAERAKRIHSRSKRS